MQVLIASAESFGGPGILVPSRNSELLRWCLANGLRVVQPMTLMSVGLYSEPAGAWLPSILFGSLFVAYRLGGIYFSGSPRRQVTGEGGRKDQAG